MDDINYDARGALDRASYPPRRLVLIQRGVLLAATLAASLIGWLLNNISSGGGLGSLGTQAMLSTAAVVLQLTVAVLTPFWAAGLTQAALDIYHGRSFGVEVLTVGFRRWKPILSSSLFMGIQYLTAVILGSYLGEQLFLFTPCAVPVLTASMEGTLDGSVSLLSLLSPGGKAVYLLMLLGAVALLAVPMFYRYRMVRYLILDKEDMGGMQSMFLSRAMMLRRKRIMLKLDLRFWWYYLPMGLALVMTNAPSLLTVLSCTVPSWCRWLCPILGGLAQLGLSLWALPKVLVTYAHCYDRFLQTPPPAPQSGPKDLPWERWGGDGSAEEAGD